MPYPAIIPEMFSHISENVPVNLLLFASEEDGKLSFSSGFVHAPLSAEQSIVIPLPSYTTKVISSESPGSLADANEYFRGIAETLVAQDAHGWSVSYSDPFVSLSAVKSNPVKTVKPLQVYPELKGMLSNVPESMTCYMVECTGNVISPKRALEVANHPDINTSAVAPYPDSTAGWLVWGDPGDEDGGVVVYAGVGLPNRRSEKFFRQTSTPTISTCIVGLIENSGWYGDDVAAMLTHGAGDLTINPPAYKCFTGTYKPLALEPRKDTVNPEDLYILPVFIDFSTQSTVSTCEIVGAFEALASTEAP